MLYTNPDYIDVIEAIGIDRAISVRLAIVNEILSLLHIGGVEHIALLEGEGVKCWNLTLERIQKL